MTIILASIPHTIDQGEETLRQVMKRSNAVQFDRISPIFDGHAAFYHVAIAPQHIESFSNDAREMGISVITERHKD